MLSVFGGVIAGVLGCLLLEYAKTSAVQWLIPIKFVGFVCVFLALVYLALYIPLSRPTALKGFEDTANSSKIILYIAKYGDWLRLAFAATLTFFIISFARTLPTIFPIYTDLFNHITTDDTLTGLRWKLIAAIIAVLAAFAGIIFRLVNRDSNNGHYVSKLERLQAEIVEKRGDSVPAAKPEPSVTAKKPYRLKVSHFLIGVLALFLLQAGCESLANNVDNKNAAKRQETQRQQYEQQVYDNSNHMQPSEKLEFDSEWSPQIEKLELFSILASQTILKTSFAKKR
jgi:MFS family permease